MEVVKLPEAKQYLRVDFDDEDELIQNILTSAHRICKDEARLTDEEWENILGDTEGKETIRIAILYTTAYLFEHREEADHHALTLDLRAMLFGIRRGRF